VKRLRDNILKDQLNKSFSIYYFERETGFLEKEEVMAGNFIKWLYSDPFGNLALESVVKHKALSKLYGKYMNSRLSALKIRSFIRLFNINMSEYEKHPDEYISFNDFFTRRLKSGCRRIDRNYFSVVSPADGKLIAFNNIQMDHNFLVKGYRFSLPEFLNCENLATEFREGSMIVIRVTPSDYHWFHFPVNGIPSQSHVIKGQYYSVSPISIHNKTSTFKKNRREFTIINTSHFGDMIMVEVGATFVGSIKQFYMPSNPYRKGDIKGHFKFGGSSVVLLFKKDTIQIDSDLTYNSRLSFETKVKMGERIAVKKL